jgi:hypothetical protein
MAAKPKQIALSVGLGIGLVLIVWQGRVKWDEAQAERQSSINVPVKRITPPPVVPEKKPDAVQAAKYADVAAKNLFSKDRNPTVVVDPPKTDPPKVMPPFPVVYGVLGLPSGVKAIMAERAGQQSKPVHTGDEVGEFKILALDLRKVTFEWNGKQLEKNLDDLADHSGAAAAPVAASAVPAGPAAPPPPANTANQQPTSAALGKETGAPDAPSRTCTPGDNSPVGSVVDGYKKIGAMTPFGVMGCSWVPNK